MELRRLTNEAEDTVTHRCEIPGLGEIALTWNANIFTRAWQRRFIERVKETLAPLEKRAEEEQKALAEGVSPTASKMTLLEFELQLDEAQQTLYASVLAETLQEWDVTAAGKPLPVTLENLQRIPTHRLLFMLDFMRSATLPKEPPASQEAGASTPNSSTTSGTTDATSLEPAAAEDSPLTS